MEKKVYVCSGELAVVLIAESQLDAVTKAFKKAHGKKLDPRTVYIDERGFRHNDTAKWKIPVEQALAEAGYVFEDSGDADGGSGDTPPSECSPSVEE